ncbi:MAG: hypothetical protein ACRDPQ_16155 [Nocardioidaceae bacterium]
MDTSNHHPDPAVQRAYDESLANVELRGKLEEAERPVALECDVYWLLCAARDAITKAIKADDPSGTENHASRAEALCRMAVEKILEWAVAEHERDVAS